MTSTQGLEFYDLTQQIGHNMPQWPSVASTVLTINRLQYHAMHGQTVRSTTGSCTAARTWTRRCT